MIMNLEEAEQLQKLKEFAHWALKYCDKCTHIDSFEFEDKALKLGLIVEVGQEVSPDWHYEFSDILRNLE